MPRTYLCKKCGLPKKGHTCLYGSAAAPPASPRMQRSSAGRAKAVIACLAADSEDDEDAAVRNSGQKRKRIVLDDDSSDESGDDEVEEEDVGDDPLPTEEDGADDGPDDPPPEAEGGGGAGNVAKRQCTSGRAEEGRRLLQQMERFVAETEEEAVRKETLHVREVSELQERIAAMEKDAEEMKKRVQEHEAKAALRVVPWEIYISVTSKLSEFLRQETERITEENAKRTAAAATGTQGTTPPDEVWTVKLDTGAMFTLPQPAQDGINAAVQKFKGPDAETFQKVFSQNHNGQEFVYDVTVDQDFAIWQVNRTTGTKRELVKGAPSLSAGGIGPNNLIDITEHMNGYSIPLRDSAGKFVFQEEYDKLSSVLYDDAFYETPSAKARGMFNRLVDAFVAPFLACTLADAVGWLRPSQLCYFLSLAHEAYAKGTDASLIVWAHGTGNEGAVKKDLWGLNQRYSTPGNAKGPGVYVATNPYVPMQWASQGGGASGRVIVGVAILRGNDPLAERYRMDPHVHIAKEPSQWKKRSVHHALVLRNSQLSAAIPLGSVKMQ